MQPKPENVHSLLTDVERLRAELKRAVDAGRHRCEQLQAQHQEEIRDLKQELEELRKARMDNYLQEEKQFTWREMEKERDMERRFFGFW